MHFKYLLGLSMLVPCGKLMAQNLQSVTNNGFVTNTPIEALRFETHGSSKPGWNPYTNLNQLSGLKMWGDIADVAHNGIGFSSYGGGGAAIGFFRGGSYDTGIDFYTNYSVQTDGNLVHRMRLSSAGDLGLGTQNPMVSTYNNGLQIARGGHSSLILGNPSVDGQGGIIQTSDNSHRVFIGANLYDDQNLSWKNFKPNIGGAGISVHAGQGVGQTGIEFYTGKQDGLASDYIKMIIREDGKVGIGTSDPKEKLSVNGGIRAHEVKVETTGWPDYVFEDGYDLGKLDALETYIRLHKHLPDVPSAKEVELTGVSLGKMNKILLKKVEELTLHLIQKEKQGRKQDQRIQNLEQVQSEMSKILKQLLSK